MSNEFESTHHSSLPSEPARAGITHSVRNDFTGLAMAALID